MYKDWSSTLQYHWSTVKAAVNNSIQFHIGKEVDLLQKPVLSLLLLQSCNEEAGYRNWHVTPQHTKRTWFSLNHWIMCLCPSGPRRFQHKAWNHGMAWSAHADISPPRQHRQTLCPQTFMPENIPKAVMQMYAVKRVQRANRYWLFYIMPQTCIPSGAPMTPMAKTWAPLSTAIPHARPTVTSVLCWNQRWHLVHLILVVKLDQHLLRQKDPWEEYCLLLMWRSLEGLETNPLQGKHWSLMWHYQDII